MHKKWKYGQNYNSDDVRVIVFCSVYFKQLFEYIDEH